MFVSFIFIEIYRADVLGYGDILRLIWCYFGLYLGWLPGVENAYI